MAEAGGIGKTLSWIPRLGLYKASLRYLTSPCNLHPPTLHPEAIAFFNLKSQNKNCFSGLAPNPDLALPVSIGRLGNINMLCGAGVVYLCAYSLKSLLEVDCLFCLAIALLNLGSEYELIMQELR
jgi:hypothetical protein